MSLRAEERRRGKRQEAREERQAATAAPVEAPAPGPAQVLALQRSAGNAAVAGLLARPPVARLARMPDGTLQWPDTFARADRGTGKDKKDIVVTLPGAKADPTATNLDVGGKLDELSPAHRAILDFVAEQRNSLESTAKELKPTSYQGKHGYMYAPPTGGDTTPTQVQGAAKTDDERVDRWIWEELSHEGHTSSINAYDSQKVTWGRGLGAATGGMIGLMDTLMADAVVGDEFRKFGVVRKGKEWLVLNTTTGRVESGNNALSLMQVDRKVLAVFIHIATTHAQKVADAQWKEIDKSAAKVPPYALKDPPWTKPLVQVVAHITHWGPAWGWSYKPDTYKDATDALSVFKTFMKVASGGQEHSGAWVLSNRDAVNNFKRWGGGVLYNEVIKPLMSGPHEFSKFQIRDRGHEKWFKDRFVLAAPGSGWYVLDKLPDDVVKELESMDKTVHMYRYFNALSMNDILRKMKAEWPEAKQIDAAFFSPEAETRLKSAGVFWERLQWAAKVVRDRKIPEEAAPGDLEATGQVETARVWLEPKKAQAKKK